MKSQSIVVGVMGEGWRELSEEDGKKKQNKTVVCRGGRRRLLRGYPRAFQIRSFVFCTRDPSSTAGECASDLLRRVARIWSYAGGGAVMPVCDGFAKTKMYERWLIANRFLSASADRVAAVLPVGFFAKCRVCGRVRQNVVVPRSPSTLNSYNICR